MNTNTTVLFDMDGVICHTNPFHTLAFRAFFEKRSLFPTDEAFAQHMFGKSNSYIFAHFLGRKVEGAEFKALEKRWNRELKNAQKNKKRTKRGGNKSPSGFVKPTKISAELAKFLNKPDGSEMARTEVTKEINTYIKSNNLQDPDNGRHIVPDAKLASLLKIGSDDKLTYFNLQKYMSQHFIKTPKPVSA